MTTASLDHIRALARDTGGPHASLFFPADIGPDHTAGIVRQARSRLREYGWPDDFLVDPSEEQPIRGRAPATAMFSAPGWDLAFPVPHDLRQQVVIAESFHVKPVLPMLSHSGRYFLLVLSAHGVRLYEGSNEELREVESDELARTPEQVLAYDRLQKQREFHVAGHAGSHGRVIAHGQGIGDEVRKEHLHQYLIHVARVLPSVVPAGEPLVLAGVGYLQAMFRQSWPRAIPESITGNVDHLSHETLHARSRDCVDYEVARRRTAAAEGFRSLRGTDLTTTRLGTVLQASQQGRIETLWASVDRDCWGNPGDPNTCEPEPAKGLEDLLNLAAARTLLSGGTVFAVGEDEVPEGGPVAAILRY